MNPLPVFFLILMVGFIMARLVITTRQFRPFKTKRYVMTVRHHAREFTATTLAKSKRTARDELLRDIQKLIIEAGLNPHDGTTEYRLFGEAFEGAQPENILVFKPDKQQTTLR